MPKKIAISYLLLASYQTLQLIVESLNNQGGMTGLQIWMRLLSIFKCWLLRAARRPSGRASDQDIHHRLAPSSMIAWANKQICLRTCLPQSQLVGQSGIIYYQLPVTLLSIIVTLFAIANYYILLFPLLQKLVHNSELAVDTINNK
jgi:hypothetical protein